MSKHLTFNQLFNDKLNVVRLISQYGLFGKDDYINSDYISQLYYTCILKKFRVKMNDEEYNYFLEYQIRLHDFIKKIRNFNNTYVEIILEYIAPISICLVNNIILSWCLPHIMDYHSCDTFNIMYKNNINKYSSKITRLINHIPLKEYCVNILSDNCFFHAHNILYLWPYFNMFTIIPVLVDDTYAAYIGIQYMEDQEFTIELSFNLKYMVQLYDTSISSGFFISMIFPFLQNEKYVNVMLTSEKSQLYKQQMKEIINIYPHFCSDQIKLIFQNI